MQAMNKNGISDYNEYDDLNVLSRFPGDVLSLGM